MSQAGEVPIILGCPDYDVPLGKPVVRDDGLAVTGRDSLGYLWRFAGRRASLWARRDGAVGAYRGEIPLEREAPEDAEGQCDLLRDAQVLRREVQAAYVNVVETLLAMAGPTPRPQLQMRLRAMRAYCGDALLMFTDPPDDAAHAAFRMMPEITSVGDVAAEDRARLWPLAVSLLRMNARLLGIEDPAGMMGLVG